MKTLKISREVISNTIKEAFEKEGDRDFLICTNEDNMPDIWHKTYNFCKEVGTCIIADCGWINTLQDENGLLPNEQGCNLDYLVNYLIDESEYLKLHHEFKDYEGNLIEEIIIEIN